MTNNFKLFNQAIWIKQKFRFLNILKTKCNSVQERVKYALSRTLLHLVFKIFKKINFTLIQSAELKFFSFFTNKGAHIFQKSNLLPQGLQIAEV